MQQARLAIIGLGRMASTIDDEVIGYPGVVLPYSLAATCAVSDRVEVVAGCDLVPEKRAAFGQRWGVKALYEDYAAMIAAEQPDLVAICTRAENHAELCCGVAALRPQGIYCEKAIACSCAEADAVLAAVGDIPFATGVLRRYDPRYEVVRQAIAAGDIGQPQVAIHYAGASLLHGHVHSIDTLLYLLGDPRIARIRGELCPRTTAIEHNRLDHDPAAVYEFETDGGVRCATHPAGNWEFEVIGTEGTVRSMNNGADALLRRKVMVTEQHHTIAPAPLPAPPPRSATLVLLEELATAALTGGRTREGVGRAHHATEACLAVAESHRAGGAWLELPLTSRELYVYHI